jgi:hypothetical protein
MQLDDMEVNRDSGHETGVVLAQTIESGGDLPQAGGRLETVQAEELEAAASGTIGGEPAGLQTLEAKSRMHE